MPQPRPRGVQRRKGRVAQPAHVVEVEQIFHVRRSEFGTDRQRRLRRSELIARHVLRIERLDEQRTPGLGRQGRGPAQVGDERPAAQRRIDPGRDDAGHHVQPRHRQRPGVRQRPRQIGHEVRLLPRQPGPPTLAGRPVARRQVDQHHLDARRPRPAGHGRGRTLGVGKMDLDALETGARRGGKARGERQFGEHHRQVGGKARHRKTL